ncbi:MAG TPA: PrgI family protein [Nevskiaceae bacterium]|nr:PrgI family protein [Nevskiaceae bacterium]
MAIQQHPVPQNIASYEFRLIGEMTLKQFGWLASGTVVALVIYGLPIPDFLKWPLVTLIAFAGFAFAFMPIGERPLSTWVLAFFKAIFSPTLFIWEKKAQKPEIFAALAKTPSPAKVPIPPADKAKLAEYLQTLPSGKTPSQIEKKEEKFLQQISKLFQTAPIPIISRPTFQAPPIPLVSRPAEKPTRPVEKPILPKPEKIIVVPPKPIKPRPAAVPAKPGPQLPFPEPPTRPNILAGMVLDKKGEMIEGAILEIRNSQGMPVRALRTNKLGQFTIATPLPNDIYEIETEKEGYDFDIIKLEVKGEIIKPIEVRVKQ